MAEWLHKGILPICLWSGLGGCGKVRGSCSPDPFPVVGGVGATEEYPFEGYPFRSFLFPPKM
eukprot:2931597-Amphidinium_carterae.1